MTESTHSDGNGTNGPNPLKDVQNILGFLLAGFAGILSFLGLRSGEVSAVLRNPDTEASASFIVLILFLAVLAAVYGVAVSGDKKIPMLWAPPIAIALLGVVSLAIYATPTNGSYGVYRTISLVIAYILLITAAVTSLAYSASKKLRSSVPLKSREVQRQLLSIMVSVALLGISIYGAMRLEAYSQRMASVQISASIAKMASDETLTAHVTGAKLQNIRYVGIAIFGLPGNAHPIKFCRTHEHKRYTNCVEEPCRYLPGTCQLIYGAAVPANANGGLNYTLNDGLVPGNYQEVRIQAEVCQQRIGCIGSEPISFLDIHLSNLPTGKRRPSHPPATSHSPSPAASHSSSPAASHSSAAAALRMLIELRSKEKL
jgi:hypothetical protein